MLRLATRPLGSKLAPPPGRRSRSTRQSPHQPTVIRPASTSSSAAATQAPQDGSTPSRAPVALSALSGVKVVLARWTTVGVPAAASVVASRRSAAAGSPGAYAWPAPSARIRTRRAMAAGSALLVHAAASGAEIEGAGRAAHLLEVLAAAGEIECVEGLAQGALVVARRQPRAGRDRRRQPPPD